MSRDHLPVMVEEVLTHLAPERGGLFVDCTVGLGGHAEALLERGPRARLVGLDRDPRALAAAGQRLRRFASRVRLVEAPFSRLGEAVEGEAVDGGILADLGVSSLQLDRAERGFSLQRDGPLDMRMGEGDLTAAEVVNRYEEDELREVFQRYGEERMAGRIAHAIAEVRAERPITTTGQLRDLVVRAKGRPREGRIDAATRVFQALRIEVNRELEELERLLEEAVRLLSREGRLVILSYHSLEDRRVKRHLRDLAQGVKDPVTGRPREETRLLELLTRRAERPSETEVAANPRARSARLRAARRL
ncbi:MAG TPA: 16S rRNA (cytosine(1402)-N(4))-methyltransferase RsmH [Thermoanaerobaculia bacterium]|nr:16S rRNA (cytosine(1402)-N(4))-methyltransferase RsmH [Thermoanaerobaculia bacterium]